MEGKECKMKEERHVALVDISKERIGKNAVRGRTQDSALFHKIVRIDGMREGDARTPILIRKLLKRRMHPGELTEWRRSEEKK